MWQQCKPYIVVKYTTDALGFTTAHAAVASVFSYDDDMPGGLCWSGWNVLVNTLSYWRPLLSTVATML
jgi:hypothetical protein